MHTSSSLDIFFRKTIILQLLLRALKKASRPGRPGRATRTTAAGAVHSGEAQFDEFSAIPAIFAPDLPSPAQLGAWNGLEFAVRSSGIHW